MCEHKNKVSAQILPEVFFTYCFGHMLNVAADDKSKSWIFETRHGTSPLEFQLQWNVHEKEKDAM